VGIFDRFLSKVEQSNSQLVFDDQLRKLDAKIAEHKERITGLRVKERTLAGREDGSEQGYAELVTQAEVLLTDLQKQRRALELERLTGPAAQAVAEARIGLADDESGLGPAASSSALSSVRDDVNALKERASGGYLDANGVPIHGRQAALTKKSKEANAREQLEQMKRQLRGEDD
jgi:hypothetical protein